MKKFARLLFAGLLLTSAMAAHAALPAEVNGRPLPSLAPMLERVTPAVVNISTISHVRAEDHPLLRDPFFRWFLEIPRQRTERHNQSLGSGVIVDAARGHVLTNHHVIEKADEIQVTLHDGRELRASLLGADPDTDIAVLQIQADDLTAVPLADSRRLRVGDFVVAIGSPFGLAHTVTSGIVSALGRSGLGIEGYENFIQTDASINPGNSGGPLVDLNGDLVGINTAILAPSGGNVGIGFAIPVNMAKAISRQIIEHGSVDRGTFGVSAQALTPQLARALGVAGNTRGALINDVQTRSAAEQAGLRAGDVVVAVNDQPISSATELETQLALLRIGAPVNLEVLRDGRSRLLKARIADPYEHFVDGSSISAQLAGAVLGEVIDKSEFGTNQGIGIGRVKRDSQAWQNGLRAGDVVFQVNRQRVKTLDALARIAGNEIHQLKLRRDDRLITLTSR
jgi:Do/DeqQ family serine protease